MAVWHFWKKSVSWMQNLMMNGQWLQYLFVPVDKHVAVYDTRTWNVVSELKHSSVNEVCLSLDLFLFADSLVCHCCCSCFHELIWMTPWMKHRSCNHAAAWIICLPCSTFKSRYFNAELWTVAILHGTVNASVSCPSLVASVVMVTEYLVPRKEWHEIRCVVMNTFIRQNRRKNKGQTHTYIHSTSMCKMRAVMLASLYIQPKVSSLAGVSLATVENI